MRFLKKILKKLTQNNFQLFEAIRYTNKEAKGFIIQNKTNDITVPGSSVVEPLAENENFRNELDKWESNNENKGK